MDDLPLTELGETERRLLAIFLRYGRDGRALTTQSLAANAGMPADSTRLATALNNLAVKGLIKRGGGDPFPWSPIAFRLSRPMPRRQCIDAIKALGGPDTAWADRPDRQAAKSSATQEQLMYDRAGVIVAVAAGIRLWLMQHNPPRVRA
jgi:hypothetical protein